MSRHILLTTIPDKCGKYSSQLLKTAIGMAIMKSTAQAKITDGDLAVIWTEFKKAVKFMCPYPVLVLDGKETDKRDAEFERVKAEKEELIRLCNFMRKSIEYHFQYAKGSTKHLSEVEFIHYANDFIKEFRKIPVK